MEETNKEPTANTEVPVPAEPPPAPPVDVAPPVETNEPAKPDERPKPKEGPSLTERLGAPAARLRTMQGAPVVGLAVAGFLLLVISVLLALMVFAPAAAPFRLGTTKAGYAAQRDLAIEKVADRFAHNLLTFDYRTLDANLQALAKDATGSYSRQIATLRKDSAIAGALSSKKATSTGTVLGQTVRSVRGDTAVVRVFMFRTVRNSSDKAAQQSVGTVDLTLVKTPNGWKVDTAQEGPTS